MPKHGNNSLDIIGGNRDSCARMVKLQVFYSSQIFSTIFLTWQKRRGQKSVFIPGQLIINRSLNILFSIHVPCFIFTGMFCLGFWVGPLEKIALKFLAHFQRHCLTISPFPYAWGTSF